MKIKAGLCFLVVLFFSNLTFAQSNELGLTIGAAQPEDARTTEGLADVKKGFAFQINYSTRIANFGVVALYADVPFAVSTKNTIEVLPTVSLATREYQSYYFTPGVKAKVLPKAKVSPYGVFGYGFAWLRPRDRATGELDIFDRVKEFSPAYSFGGGVDVKVNRTVAIRGEVRSYHTKPFDLESFGVIIPGVDFDFLREGQRNVFFTGGVVLRF